MHMYFSFINLKYIFQLVNDFKYGHFYKYGKNM